MVLGLRVQQRQIQEPYYDAQVQQLAGLAQRCLQRQALVALLRAAGAQMELLIRSDGEDVLAPTEILNCSESLFGFEKLTAPRNLLHTLSYVRY